jgi:hypothetical protein
VWDHLAPHFGVGMTESLKQRMAAVTRIHSKSKPAEATVFVADNERKRAAASFDLRRAINEVARPAYAELLDRERPAIPS